MDRVKRYNITAPRKYESRGQEKTAWPTVGTLVHFDGEKEGFVLELNMFPNTTFKLFEQKEKEDTKE